MEENNVRKYIGKKVLIILKNNWRYTCLLPDFQGSSFSIKDKYGEIVEISCDFINFIKEINNE